MTMEKDANAFERFLAGEDRLARLLRAVPAFEPPATMEAAFADIARRAQAEHAPRVFEPPASMEANFLAAAAQVQAAQQPRHDAVIGEIRAGKPAAEVLGHDVAQATAEWLASRPQRLAAREPAPVAPAWWRSWLPRAGMLLASAMAGAVVTNLWLAQRGEQAHVATTMKEESASAETAAADAKALPPPVALAVPQVAEVRRVSPPSSPGQARRAQAAIPAPPPHAMVAEPEAEGMLGEAPSESHKEALAVADAIAAAPRLEQAPAAAPAAPARPAPMSAAASGMAAERSVAAPAAKAQARRVSSGMRVSVTSSPESAANAWQAAGHDSAPRIFAAHPASASVHAWVERFRQALPQELRPTQLDVIQDDQLGEERLRLDAP